MSRDRLDRFADRGSMAYVALFGLALALRLDGPSLWSSVAALASLGAMGVTFSALILGVAYDGFRSLRGGR